MKKFNEVEFAIWLEDLKKVDDEQKSQIILQEKNKLDNQQREIALYKLLDDRCNKRIENSKKFERLQGKTGEISNQICNLLDSTKNLYMLSSICFSNENKQKILNKIIELKLEIDKKENNNG